jgi:hypothetical protein
VTEVLDRTQSGHGSDEHCHHHHRRDIIAVIDNVDIPLHRGHYDLDTLKTLGKVAASDTLLQLVGTKLERVPADRPIEICGGEIFASHPPGGGAS